MPNETTAADEKKKKKSLDGQASGMKPTPEPKKPAPQGPTSSQAYDRTHLHIGDEAGKRAAAEEGVAQAEVQARVQPSLDTPEKRADAWVKANGKALGIGNRAAYFKKIKEGLSPAEAWKAVGGK